MYSHFTGIKYYAYMGVVFNFNLIGKDNISSLFFFVESPLPGPFGQGSSREDPGELKFALLNFSFSYFVFLTLPMALRAIPLLHQAASGHI
jgi:hypothetical protein